MPSSSRLTLIIRRYIETINLIYANKIHIRSTFLIQNINKFLLPQRLTTITSLELICDLLDEPPTEAHLQLSSGRHWSLYTTLMTTIPQTLPSITTLHISIEATFYITHSSTLNLEILAPKLFAPADAITRSLGSQLHAFELAPNASLYKALARRATEQEGAREEKGPPGGPFWRRYWRSIDLADRNGRGAEQVGYWVGQGKDDTPVWYEIFD
ncbi:MAG: hypothetical protein Q9182_004172 [Xanthomendoza sp. 2 TL-2023]